MRLKKTKWPDPKGMEEKKKKSKSKIKKRITKIKKKNTELFWCPNTKPVQKKRSQKKTQNKV